MARHSTRVLSTSCFTCDSGRDERQKEGEGQVEEGVGSIGRWEHTPVCLPQQRREICGGGERYLH